MLTTILLLLVINPAFAITQNELDQINTELKNDPEITRPITVDAPKSGWNDWDNTLLALEIIDWGQTRYTASKHAFGYWTNAININTGKTERIYIEPAYEYEEMNPILGKHPSIEQVNNYFIPLIGLHILIANYANPNIHRYWNIAAITLETYCVTNNYKIGIKVKF